MHEIAPLVLNYLHDKQRPRSAEALHTLRRVASLVKPIMRRRDWRVGTLAEFYPAQRNLLGININMGHKICLRLRHPGDEAQFLRFEDVVDTMLHELCHNVHGQHNKSFHALWNQLRDEVQELLLKGYTGEGFLSKGHRLGGRSIPVDEARRVARAAAEQRRSLSAGSGRKLGGAPISRGADMRKVIADAAQSRLDVTKGCASGSKEGERLAEEYSRQGFLTVAEEDDATERAIMEAYIEMIQEEERSTWGSSYVPPSKGNPAGPRGNIPSEGPPIPIHSKPKNQLSSTREALPESVPQCPIMSTGDADDVQWSCPTCTLVNPPAYLCCDACGSERPVVPPPKNQSLPVKTSTPMAARRVSSKPTHRVSKPSAGRVLSTKAKSLE